MVGVGTTSITGHAGVPRAVTRAARAARVGRGTARVSSAARAAPASRFWSELGLPAACLALVGTVEEMPGRRR